MWLQKLIPFRKRTVKKDPEHKRDLSETFSEHAWDLPTIVHNFSSSNIYAFDVARSGGLSTTEVNRLIGIHGPNALPKAKEISDFMLFLSQFWNLLWALLGAAMTLSFAQWLTDVNELSNLYIAVILAVMIIFMCFVSFWQERKARKAVHAFTNLLADNCNVIRNGREISVPAPQVARGDIIVIRSGNRVPADARILKCTEFKLESSSITGEAEPIEYTAESVSEDVSVFDAKNIAFNGSMCVDGFGYAVVIRTGADTVIGQIASMTTGQKDKGSILQKEISRFVKFLIISATISGTVCFIVGGFVFNWKDIMGLITNGFVVSAIGLVPCGIAATVTSTLTLVARRMAKNNVCLKRLDIVEALGCLNIIASDKAGTLTKNIMTVTDLWYCNKVVEGIPNKDQNGVGVKAYSFIMERLFTVMTVCNVAEFLDSDLKDKQSGEFTNHGFTSNEHDQRIDNSVRRPAKGSPSEVAMLHFVAALFDHTRLRQQHNMVFEIPFTSKRKWHLQIHKERNVDGGKAQYRLMMKGAPEILIKKCSKIYTDDGTEKLTDARFRDFQAAYDNFGSEGKRVIGMVETIFIADANIEFKTDLENFPTSDLTFIGMSAIMDPPRDETAGAIKACKEAGIKVFMVTGDHPSTAAAIARDINLLDPDRAKNCVIHGDRISKMSEQDWDAVLANDYLVFARTTPEQKLLIVEQCQKRGQNIAMTGDGVNDSPALKKSTVGIAMGSGSEVAQQAADVILMDDNFSSIVKAVEQGRMMFENLKKLLAYTMPHSFPEIYPVVFHYCFGIPQGITGLQILTIDLGTEIMPGVSFSNEPPEHNIMKRPPRRKEQKLVSNMLLFYSYALMGQLQSLGCFLAYLFVYWNAGINVSDLFYSQKSWYEGGEVFVSNGKSFDWPAQEHRIKQSCAAWYIGIVFGQALNIWNARTRKESLFTHGIFANKMAIVGVVIEISIMCCFVYVPPLYKFVGAEPPPAGVWGCVAGVGAVMFIYNEIRKYLTRRWPKNKVLRMLKW